MVWEGEVARKRTDLAVCIDDWLSSQSVRKNAEGTQRHYHRVAKVMREMLADKALPRHAEDLLPRHIDHVVATLGKGRPGFGHKTTRPRAPYTQNQDRSVLRSLGKWLVQNRVLIHDPAAHLTTVKYVREERITELSLSRSEALSLLDVAGKRHPRDRIMVALGLYTAMRESELRELRVGDVALDEGFVDFGRQKAGGDRMKMPILPQLAEEIREWLTWYAAWYGPLDADMYMIPPRKTGACGRGAMVRADRFWPVNPWRKSGRLAVDIKVLLERIGKRAAPGQGSHILRRTWGRMMVDAGVPIREIQAGYGHSSVTMTEQYLGITPQEEALKARFADPEFQQRVWGHTHTGDNVVAFRSRRSRAS